MDKRQRTTLHTTMLTLLLFTMGLFLSNATLAASRFATLGQLYTQIAKERAFRKAADNALSVAITSTQHFIGEQYGGGIVFYVYDSGKHGLIAALADQNSSIPIRWFGGSINNTRARADGIGAGKSNTAIIIANQGAVDGFPFAATVCNEYSATDANGVTYGDWYLPSKYELNLLYSQKAAGVVGGFANGSYWSSTESDASNAWAQVFSNGAQGVGIKSGVRWVRAVRAF